MYLNVNLVSSETALAIFFLFTSLICALLFSGNVGQTVDLYGALVSDIPEKQSNGFLHDKARGNPDRPSWKDTVNFSLVQSYTLSDWINRSDAKMQRVQYSATSILKDEAHLWYRHENICVNDLDGTWFFPRNSIGYEQQVTQLKLDLQTAAFRPTRMNVSEEAVRGKIVYHLPGKSLLVQCFRNPSPNPFHFTFMITKLFVFFYSRKSHIKPLDFIVLHQCGEPTLLGKTNLMLWNFVMQFGMDKGHLDAGTKYFPTSVAAPTLASRLDHFFCMDSVEVQYDLFWLTSQALSEMREKILEHIEEELVESEHVARATDLHQAGHFGGETGESDCVSSLRLAIYERHGGSRLLTNKEDIFTLFREFSNHTKIISISGDTSVDEVYKQFNSFDVLVTPHGSHMANLIFTRSKRFAVIEIVGRDFWSPASERLFWQPVIPYYDMSFPHDSTDPSVQKLIDNVSAVYYPGNSGRAEIMKSNLVVNVTRLREKLSETARYICSTS